MPGIISQSYVIGNKLVFKVAQQKVAQQFYVLKFFLGGGEGWEGLILLPIWT